MHTIHDITELHRGQDATQPFIVEDADTDTEGDRKDLTNATVTFYVARSRNDHVRTGDDAPLLEKDSSGTDVTITDAVNGEVEVRIDSADYDQLTEQSCWYELWVTDANGDEAPVVAGEVHLDK